MKSISEIKTEYKSLTSVSLMDYEKEMVDLNSFIEEYSVDERSGVRALVGSAVKKLDFWRNELKRIESMRYFENQYKEDYKAICGVDEVGRGPLAGPIVTAAVILPEEIKIPYLNDSKKLNEKRREELYDIITSVAIDYKIGIKDEKYIDSKGIAVADSDAMRDAVLALDVSPDLILVDAFKIPDLDIKQVPIIKGDAKSVSIAAASIVAKVTRDRMMEDFDKQYPGYDFSSNKGYGSAKHIEAIKSIGPSDIHRRSFISNFV